MASGAELAAMFALGLLGAGHCLGMCGPVVAAVSAGGRGRAMGAVLLYNLGRGLTYIVVGAAVAGVGAGAAQLAPVLRIQAWLTLVSGGFLGWFGLALLGLLPEPRVGAASAVPGAGPLLRRLSSEDGRTAAALPLGILLGFLPCGLSFAAFTRGLGATGALEGAALVGAFWVGTLPVMLGAGALLVRIPVQRRRVAQLLSGTVLVGMGALYLTRAA
ncbi:MAG: sulfite exporter TauE/SafE family protein, partial [Deltaproteobacteria bacterium]|nr:sulfite exporter TauE/SafE family protein [Deltaproteobacteria bacterium]